MSLKKRLSSGEFVVLAEMDTPKGVDISELVTNARRIKGRVDAVVIPDMANGVMRMSSLGGGVVMQQQGLETVIQICPRDRNMIALQGDLLSAHILGLQSIIVTPGDDISFGDHINAKAVDDLDEMGLLKAASSLQDGADLAGIEIKGPPSFTVGATMKAYPDEAGLDQELETLAQKAALGAEFIICPFVFDVEVFARFAERARKLGLPLIPSVLLLKSVGVARYLATNVPGTRISEEMIQRIRKAPDRTAECIRIAAETMAALKETAQGVQIVTLGWENRLPALLDQAGF